MRRTQRDVVCFINSRYSSEDKEKVHKGDVLYDDACGRVDRYKQFGWIGVSEGIGNRIITDTGAELLNYSKREGEFRIEHQIDKVGVPSFVKIVRNFERPEEVFDVLIDLQMEDYDYRIQKSYTDTIILEFDTKSDRIEAQEVISSHHHTFKTDLHHDGRFKSNKHPRKLKIIQRQFD